MKLGVIDYGASNIFSVVRALNSLGASTIIVKKPEDFKNTDKLVFPGQGSMGACLKKLSENNLKDSLIDALNNYPFLGICLGLQILFSESEESKGEKGLNIFSEKIKKFSEFRVSRRNKINKLNEFLASRISKCIILNVFPASRLNKFNECLAS